MAAPDFSKDAYPELTAGDLREMILEGHPEFYEMAMEIVRREGSLNVEAWQLPDEDEDI